MQTRGEMREGVHGTRGACVSMVSKVPTLPMVSEVSLTGFHLEKWMGGGGERTARDSVPSRACPPQQFFSHFRPFEIASGTFSDHVWFSNDMVR